MQPIQRQLSQQQKTFSEFFCCIFEIYIKFQTFLQKQMTLIADVFPEITTPKNMVR